MSDGDPFAIRPKMYRKRKKHEGQNWDQSETIAELEAAKRKGRVHCKQCHKFKAWSRLYCKYERVGKHKIDMVWYCSDCGAAVYTLHITTKKRRKT